MRSYRKAVAVLASLCLSSAAIAAPQVGWWWNPNESGRGFFVESQSGITFLGAYFYDADGHAKWLVAGGPNADPYNYAGPLYELTGGQTLFGSYVAPSAPSSVGNVTVHFDDDTHGTWTWPGGMVNIERQIFGGTGAAFQPRSGWWWNPSESGTGYSVELQGNNLFVVGFMYDDTGRQVWYFSAGPMSSATTYHGDVLQFANGQTMGGPYQAPSVNSKPATLDMTFQAPDKATVTFTGASAATAMGAKISQQRADEIVREFQDLFTPFYTYYPGSAIVNFDAEIPTQDIGAGNTLSASFNLTLTITEMVWQIDSVEGQPIEAGGLQTATYVLLGGQFMLTGQFQQNITVPNLGAATCTLNGQISIPLRFPFTSSAVLKVSNLGSYTLNLSFDSSLISLPGAYTCKSPSGAAIPIPPLPLPAPPLQASGTGVVDVTTILDRLPGTSSPFPFNGTLTITGNYIFLGTDDCSLATSDVVDPCRIGGKHDLARGKSTR